MTNVLISVKGSHVYEADNEDVVEMLMPGTFARTEDGYVITYNETEPDTSDQTKTTVTVDPSMRITVVREGTIHSHMIFEQGQKHLVYYDTEYGALTVGVSASKINSTLSEKGGDLEIDYAIEIDNSVASLNRFRLNVRKTKLYPLS